MNKEWKNSEIYNSIVDYKSVKNAVENDLGENYSLISFKFDDFTKKGDNYASLVTSIKAKLNHNKNNSESEVTYIVKLNPKREAELWNSIENDFFIHEGEFFKTICPELNKILSSISETPLNMPQSFFRCYTPMREHLINEDMRQKNFIMLDRKKGMDLNHTLVMLRELAKLHAASFILEKNKGILFEEQFPMFKRDLTQNTKAFTMFCAVMDGQIKNTIDILKELNIYEGAIQVLEVMKNNSKKIYLQQCLSLSSPKFRCLTHGDCWVNNFLFR